MKRLVIIIIIALIILATIICDLLFPVAHHNNGFWWTHILGFFLLFGFIGCLILIIIPKIIGHSWLQRKEDYYD